MGSLAEKIGEQKFQPGIWLAPFLAAADSELFSENPNWFVKDKKGKPLQAIRNPDWGFRRGFHALDFTNPQAQEYIGDLFNTIVNKWGYSYLKLDFLYVAALPGSRFNRHQSRAEALRRGLEVIRKAAGKRPLLLVAGVPWDLPLVL